MKIRVLDAHPLSIPLRCAIGLCLGVNLGAAETPAPLTSALERLQSPDGYVWTLDTQMPGTPFSFAPISGWARPDGQGMMIATLDEKPIEAAILGDRRVVKLKSSWMTSDEATPKKKAEAGEVSRLLNLPLPGETLPALLNQATAVRTNEDGSFSADFSADVAAEIVRSPTEYLPKRRFTPSMKDATASLQLWIRNGALVRYEISGTARVSLPIGSKEIKQTTVVELHEKPAADAALPADALGKLQTMANR